MKKFLITASAYFLTLALIVFALNQFYWKRLKPDFQAERFRHVPDNIQICNFGSSHGFYGFNYADAQETTFNFALPAQMPSYDCRILKRYEGKLAEKATVYLVISYFSFLGMDETLIEGFDTKNATYYRFLPAQYVKAYDIKTMLFIKYWNLPKGEDWIHACFMKPQTMDDIWTQTTNADDAAKDAVRAYTAHLVTNKQDASGKRIINQEEIDALYEMISICREKGAEPVLVITPFLSEYLDMIEENAPDFFGEFYGIFDKVAQDTGVRHYDYSSDERFSHDYSLFRDADHLNKTGARKFTNLLLQETLTQ